jgi:hypothetical protein
VRSSFLGEGTYENYVRDGYGRQLCVGVASGTGITGVASRLGAFSGIGLMRTAVIEEMYAGSFGSLLLTVPSSFAFGGTPAPSDLTNVLGVMLQKRPPGVSYDYSEIAPGSRHPRKVDPMGTPVPPSLCPPPGACACTRVEVYSGGAMKTKGLHFTRGSIIKRFATVPGVEDRNPSNLGPNVIPGKRLAFNFEVVGYVTGDPCSCFAQQRSTLTLLESRRFHRTKVSHWTGTYGDDGAVLSEEGVYGADSAAFGFDNPLDENTACSGHTLAWLDSPGVNGDYEGVRVEMRFRAKLRVYDSNGTLQPGCDKLIAIDGALGYSGDADPLPTLLP